MALIVFVRVTGENPSAVGVGPCGSLVSCDDCEFECATIVSIAGRQNSGAALADARFPIARP